MTLQKLLLKWAGCIEYNGTREVLLKGKAQYNWPPPNNYFRSAPLYIDNIIYIFYKVNYLIEEVNCTEPFPSLSIPWQHRSRCVNVGDCVAPRHSTEQHNAEHIWA